MGDFCVDDLGSENPLKDHYAPLFHQAIKSTELAIAHFKPLLEEMDADLIMLEERVQNLLVTFSLFRPDIQVTLEMALIALALNLVCHYQEYRLAYNEE